MNEPVTPRVRIPETEVRGLRTKSLSGMLTSRRFILSFLGVLALLTGWQVLALLMHSIVIASPLDTFGALIRMMGTVLFWGHLWASFRRILTGIILGGTAGFILGLFGGLNRDIRYFLEPLRWTLMSVPAVVVVVMAMLWFGMGSAMVVFITSLLLAPIVYVNTVRGLEMVDESIIEMAQLYNFSLWLTIRHVYIPAITGPLASAVVIIAGMGVRIVILAEVMGTFDGIGYALSLTRSNLETPALFAWMLVTVGIVGFIEYVLLKPIEERVLRWKT